MTAMSGTCHWRISVLALTLAAFGGAPAEAAPGDIHRVVNADLVNLRAGPSEESSVRGTIERGDEVIELTRQRQLARRARAAHRRGRLDLRTTPGAGGAQHARHGWPPTSRRRRLLATLEGFNRLIRSINADLGYPIVQEVQQPEADLLRVVPSRDWLINGSREAHLMAAAAMYEMWKNHQNGAPVRLVMVDDEGRDYITIVDDETGPNLSIALPARG